MFQEVKTWRIYPPEVGTEDHLHTFHSTCRLPSGSPQAELLFENRPSPLSSHLAEQRPDNPGKYLHPKRKGMSVKYSRLVHFLTTLKEGPPQGKETSPLPIREGTGTD